MDHKYTLSDDNQWEYDPAAICAIRILTLQWFHIDSSAVSAVVLY